MIDDDPSSFPLESAAFQAMARWCQQYLELQHSRDVGRLTGRLLAALGDIATAPRDGVDRFEWLKQREHDVNSALQQLAEAVQDHAWCASHPGSDAPADESQATTNLFVYGTLKQGYSRSAALAGQKFLGLARTRPQYRMYDCGGYPGLIFDPAGGVSVEGELWQIDRSCLARLDEIEGVALRLYARRKLDLSPPHDQLSVEAYFYLRSVAGHKDCGACWQ